MNHRILSYSNYKIIIAILIAIIIFLFFFLLVRENQHVNELLAISEKEVQKEEYRLELANKHTENYNALQEENLRLTVENMELKYGSNIKWGRFDITGYTQYDEGCNNITSIGVNLNKSWTHYFNFVAVDPDVIPYGSVLIIKLEGDLIIALAVDCGFLIKGYRLDLYFNTLKEARDFGVKEDVLVGVIE